MLSPCYSDSASSDEGEGWEQRAGSGARQKAFPALKSNLGRRVRAHMQKLKRQRLLQVGQGSRFVI